MIGRREWVQSLGSLLGFIQGAEEQFRGIPVRALVLFLNCKCLWIIVNIFFNIYIVLYACKFYLDVNMLPHLLLSCLSWSGKFIPLDSVHVSTSGIPHWFRWLFCLWPLPASGIKNNPILAKARSRLYSYFMLKGFVIKDKKNHFFEGLNA